MQPCRPCLIPTVVGNCRAGCRVRGLPCLSRWKVDMPSRMLQKGDHIQYVCEPAATLQAPCQRALARMSTHQMCYVQKCLSSRTKSYPNPVFTKSPLTNTLCLTSMSQRVQRWLRNFADLLTKVLFGKKRRDLVGGVLYDIYDYYWH